MLFKILHGDKSRISTDITPYHEGYCYTTHDGDFYVDMNNERVKLNAKDAETLTGKSLDEIKEYVQVQEIYIGDGDMPQDATIQILLDGSDEEQALLDSLKEYTDTKITTAKSELVGTTDDATNTDTINAAKNLAKELVQQHTENVNSNFATKEYVEEEIATFDFIKVVDTLPIGGFANRVYLVPKKDTQTQDLFDEYIWINRGTEENPDWGWEWVTTKQVEIDLTPYATNEFVTGQISDTKNYADNAATAALKKVYPVGSVYLTFNTANPAELFGFGTWKKLTDRFLVGAGSTYDLSATGGAASHTLTAKELPKISGTISMHGTYAGTAIASVSGAFSAKSTVSGKYMSGSSSGADSIDKIEFNSGGQGQAHNNLPPYLAVYMWQRTA